MQTASNRVSFYSTDIDTKEDEQTMPVWLFIINRQVCNTVQRPGNFKIFSATRHGLYAITAVICPMALFVFYDGAPDALLFGGSLLGINIIVWALLYPPGSQQIKVDPASGMVIYQRRGFLWVRPVLVTIADVGLAEISLLSGRHNRQLIISEGEQRISVVSGMFWQFDKMAGFILEVHHKRSAKPV